MYSDILGGLVRIGRVSSVDKEKRTARVIFEDHDDLVSGELKVLQNHPTIAVTRRSMVISGTTGAVCHVSQGLGAR